MTEQKFNELRTEIGASLKARRQFLKLSIQEIAEKTSMQPDTVSRIEKGLFWPNMKQYILLLDALGLVYNEPAWPGSENS